MILLLLFIIFSKIVQDFLSSRTSPSESLLQYRSPDHIKVPSSSSSSSPSSSLNQTINEYQSNSDSNNDNKNNSLLDSKIEVHPNFSHSSPSLSSSSSTDTSFSSPLPHTHNESSSITTITTITTTPSKPDYISLSSNGFNLLDIQKIVESNLILNSSIISSSQGISKVHPSSIIRLLYPSGVKYDYIIPSTNDSSMSANLFHLIQTIYTQVKIFKISYFHDFFSFLIII